MHSYMSRTVVLVACSLLLAACATSPAQTADSMKPYHFTKSNKHGYDFRYGDFYLIKPKGLGRAAVRNELANCQNEGNDYVAVKSQGYPVMKSFGTSDRSQIAMTTLDCLNSVGWTIYWYTEQIYDQVGKKEIDNYFFGNS